MAPRDSGVTATAGTGGRAAAGRGLVHGLVRTFGDRRCSTGWTWISAAASSSP